VFWISAVSPEEKQHESSKSFIDRVIAANSQIVVPTLLRVEISAAFSRVGKSPILLKATIAHLVSLRSVRWISLEKALADAAAKIASVHRLRGADAVYAALASEYGCKLVSLDNDPLERVSTVMVAQTPSQALTFFENDNLSSEATAKNSQI
jgi:predicted nucleic acid-binding protein